MKIPHLIAAGLLVAGIGVSTEANAAPRRDRVVYIDHDRGYGYGNGYGYGYRYGDRFDRRHAWRGRHGYRGYHARHCWTEWRRHRRFTVCR